MLLYHFLLDAEQHNTTIIYLVSTKRNEITCMEQTIQGPIAFYEPCSLKIKRKFTRDFTSRLP